MDQVHREIVTKYKVDGIFSNRWAPQAATATASIARRTSGTATGLDLPRTHGPARSGAAAVLEWRKARLDRAVEALGRDGARGESRGARSSRTARRI